MYVLSLVIGLAAVVLLLVVAATLLGPAKRARATAVQVRPAGNPRLAILRLSLGELKSSIRRRNERKAERAGTDGSGAA